MATQKYFQVCSFLIHLCCPFYPIIMFCGLDSFVVEPSMCWLDRSNIAIINIVFYFLILDDKEDKSVSSDDSNKKDAVKSWIY